MALTKRSGGIVSATSALRIARSDGRTSPAIAGDDEDVQRPQRAGEREGHQQHASTA